MFTLMFCLKYWNDLVTYGTKVTATHQINKTTIIAFGPFRIRKCNNNTSNWWLVIISQVDLTAFHSSDWLLNRFVARYHLTACFYLYIHRSFAYLSLIVLIEPERKNWMALVHKLVDHFIKTVNLSYPWPSLGYFNLEHNE